MSRRRPDSESVPANRLTTKLRDRYSTLLRPAPRKIGGRIRQVLEALKVESDQSRRLKDLYEDRTYDQRKEELEILLGVLASDKRVDLKAAVDVLETAVWAQHQALRSGQKLDQVRTFKEQRERLKKEVRDLRKRVRAFYSRLADEVHFHVDLGFQDD